MLPTDDIGANTGAAVEPSANTLGEPQKASYDRDGDAESVDEATKNLVKKRIAEVKAAKKHWEPAFRRMREDIYFAEGNHWPDGMPGIEDPRITVDITSRHIQLRTSALYAKNPTIIARRRDTLDFAVWDETTDTLMMANEALMNAAADPVAAADAAALLKDVAEGMSHRQALDRTGRTLEIVYKHQIEHEQMPPFKTQAKALIPRTITTGVGYIKLDYQRKTGRKPGVENRLADARDKLTTAARMLAEWNDETQGSYDDTRAEYAELKQLMESIQAEPATVLKEGLLFQFPSSMAIIPDKKCKNLQGFAGCDWAAEEMLLTCEEIKETWDVDIGAKYTKYTQWHNGEIREATGAGDHGAACVYIVYNRRTNQSYVVCDGYDGWIREPATPDVQLKHFFPWYALVFNRQESETSPFPRSDVRLMMHMQRELNRTMEALRQHRIANQPKYLGDASAFEEDEKYDISNSPAHEVILVKCIAEGKKPEDVIAAIPHTAIDPNVYSTDVIYECVMRVLGSQEANLGGTSKGDTTATESSIAEASRLSSQESNKDDLDDLLSLLAREGGIVLLLNMGEGQVKRVAGRGAIWPKLSNQEVADEIYLEVQAGSSGRPNQALEIQNMERMVPFLLQIPGVDPKKLAEEIIRRMNDRLKPSDLLNSRITQSIIAMSRGSGGATTTDPNADPQQQGAEGANNAPNEVGRGAKEKGAMPAQPAAIAA